MNFIKKNWNKFVFLFYVLLIPVISLAQGNNTGKIVNPLASNTDSVQGFIQVLLKGVIQIGMPLVALAVIYCGFLFVQARGNSEKLTKAKDALLYTLIGAALLLGSWAIAQLISETVLAL